MKEKALLNHQCRLELTFTDFSGEDGSFFVQTTNGSEPLKRRVIGDRIKKTFRALCILVLLAKDRGETFFDPKRRTFYSETNKQTWMRTLAEQRKKTTLKYLLDELGLNKFWLGFKKSGESNPRVEFLPEELPLRNIRLLPPPFQKRANQELTESEIRTLAQLLEQKLLDENLPVKERWGTPIVSHCLHATDVFHGVASPSPDTDSVPLLPSKAPSLGDVQKALLYHLRRAFGENDSLALLRRYENLCNIELSPVSGDSPLLTAISFGKKNVVDWLLENPTTDVCKPNKKGVTPILKAARLNDVTLIKRLLARTNRFPAWDQGPPETTFQKRNAIHEAAFGATAACLETMQFLADCGVACSAFDQTGIDPWSLAIYRKCPEEAVNWLKNRTEEEESRLPEREAFFRKFRERERRSLMENLGGRFRETPYGLRQFENPRAPAPRRRFGEPRLWQLRGCGVLFASVAIDDVERVESLLKNEHPSDYPPYDANDEYYEMWRTALHEAAEFGSPEMIKLLVRYGADPFRQDFHGRTAREFLPHLKTTDRDRSVDSALLRAGQSWIEAEYRGLH